MKRLPIEDHLRKNFAWSLTNELVEYMPSGMKVEELKEPIEKFLERHDQDLEDLIKSHKDSPLMNEKVAQGMCELFQREHDFLLDYKPGLYFYGKIPSKS